jgi:hypothetical protein
MLTSVLITLGSIVPPWGIAVLCGATGVIIIHVSRRPAG